MAVGAHPDDCEFKLAGTAARWAAAGHTVRFVSCTNGQSGHHAIGGVELVRRRAGEALAAARVVGVEGQVLPNPDGYLEPTLAVRRMITALIREFEPDLVITHRPNDYHPDHRYTSQVLRDTAYTVTVPNIFPETPALAANPLMAYMSDGFTRPVSFRADMVVAIDEVIDRKIQALHAHTSQMYEWLAWMDGGQEVPEGDGARLAWLTEKYAPDFAAEADRFRDRLVARYGREQGRAVKYAEAFEFCEYGGRWTDELKEKLFGGL